MDNGEDPSLDRRARLIALGILIFGGATFVGLAAYLPLLRFGNPGLVFVLAIVGAVLTGIASSPEAIELLTRTAARLWKFAIDLPWWVRVTAAGTVVILTATAAVSLVSGPSDDVASDGTCRHSSQLNILTPPDGLEPVRQLADSFAKSTADDNGHCPTVFARVYTSASDVTAPLARGWRSDDSTNPQEAIGARPDVWLPSSTVDVGRVDALAAAEHNPSPIKDFFSIASSTMVVGLLGGLALPAAATWPAQVAAAIGTGAPLLAPDPEVSTIGLMAAQGYLPGPQLGGSVDSITARQRIQHVFASGSAAGDDGSTLLCRYRPKAPVRAAIVTSRELWQRFVSGEALGPGCPGGTGPRPDVKMAPTVPGTPVLDYPFVDFRWTEEPLRPAVEAFRHWLTEPAGQARLGALGFDPDRRECSTLERSRCVPPNLDAVLDVYRRSKLPGRVLLALDASGSMSAHTTGGKTRFQIAAEGVAQALGQAGLRDEVGLWTFPDASDRGSKELVKVREGTPQQRTDIVAGLNGVMPKGSTPLYPTVLAGLTAVAGGPTDSQARALVVLTDGEDTTGGRLGDVEKQVGQIASSTGVRLYIIATGDANCDATDGSGLRRLTTAGNGRCLRTGAEGVSAIMADLFGTLWSGR